MVEGLGTGTSVFIHVMYLHVFVVVVVQWYSSVVEVTIASTALQLCVIVGFDLGKKGVTTGNFFIVTSYEAYTIIDS